jgi:glycyl-tRNA synthetase beta chain
MPDFLLEIGLEEIPARMIDAAEAELARCVSDLLTRERLASSPQVEPYSTPRRLSLLARSVSPSQPDVEEQVLGPSLKVAFKDGQPTPAAQAFARKVGLGVSELRQVTTPKGDYIAADVKTKGRSAADVLADALPKEIFALYWPKNMYWRSKSERFVRPVRWLVAMLDDDVVSMVLAGKPAQKGTRGHRILAGPATIERAAEYQRTLEQVRVIVRREDRLARIRKALDAAARQVPGARWREDAELLDTVVNLTEWPSAILGNFDREFLTLPEEVLVTVMRDHQKYFAVEDASGKLAPHFIAVLNTEGDPQGIIRHGNERVLRARFNDARFFWETDQKVSLKDRVLKLKSVTFQKDLGSYYDKTVRVQKLANEIAGDLQSAGVAVRPGVIFKASWLAKADLTTELVKEFTELQGIVGGLYAKAQVLDPLLPGATREAIATAIYDQYKPVSMEDPAPRTLEGALVSISDKADSIAGMFLLGKQPSGSKDPFALRRQANGIVKTVAEYKLPLSISRLMSAAREMFTNIEPEISSDQYRSAIQEFFRERADFYLREVKGFAYDVVNAVLAAGSDDVADALARAEAVKTVRGSEDFEHISIAFKRMKNILRQASETGKQIAPGLEYSLFTDAAEKELGEAAPRTAAAVELLRKDKKYDEALRDIARLRPLVDTFFDKVMVMVEEARVRANRLALLQFLVNEFSTIADFSEIVTEGKS